MGPLPKAFLDEVNYLQRFVAKQQEEDDQELAKALNYKEYETNQALMTCGCCYADCAFEDMVQCSEGHLFCRDCARRAMEDVLGRQLTQLKCINSEEPCSAVVAESTLRTFLSAKSLQLYDRLVQEEQIKKAIIGQQEDGSSTGESGQFVTCPFCPFGALVETSADEDRIFRCLNPICLKKSCRLCALESHIPRTCEEVKSDQTESLQHRLEEAMTEALLRSCPSCQKKFFKEEGCNKMTCSCGTRTCPLWDNTKTRNETDVLNAADQTAQALLDDSVEEEHTSTDLFEKLEERKRELARGLKRGDPVATRKAAHHAGPR